MHSNGSALNIYNCMQTLKGLLYCVLCIVYFVLVWGCAKVCISTVDFLHARQEEVYALFYVGIQDVHTSSMSVYPTANAETGKYAVLMAVL